MAKWRPTVAAGRPESATATNLPGLLASASSAANPIKQAAS